MSDSNIKLYGTLIRDDDTNTQKIVNANQVAGGYFVCASVPTSGTWLTGQLCYCTADSKFYQYNGSSWQEKEFGGTNATDSADKLYLVGAKDQTSNPQTYSNSKVYMTDGDLTTNSITTYIVRSSNSNVTIQTISPDGVLHGVAFFNASSSNGTSISAQGYLDVWGNDDNNNPYKPLNRTGFSDLDTYYFNTGITLRDVNGTGTQSYHQLAFPTISGTLSTIKYKHNIVLSGSFSGGPGGTAYCTFSFINNSPSAISNLSQLNTALAARFTNKICPACGLFGYSNSSSASLHLITGITYDTTTSQASIKICYNQIAETSSNTMTVAATPSTSSSRYQYPFSSATVIDTVEEC